METSTNPKVKQILNFMFPHSMAESMNLWFGKSPKTDDYIRKTFGKDVYNAVEGKYDHWIGNPDECLALIILLDQFPRNIYRHQVSFKPELNRIINDSKRIEYIEFTLKLFCFKAGNV